MQGGPNGGHLLTEHNSVSFKFDIKPQKNMTKFIEFSDCSFRIISHENIKFPINSITCLTGVSGSGKSTCAQIIEDSLNNKKMQFCKEIKNRCLRKAIYVNQSPIGKTSRSTIVSYLEIYDDIRNIFSNLEQSKKSKINPSDFSMNVKGGRCETCQGTGLKKIELNYMPEVFIKCPDCEGKRFKDYILEIKYKDLSINDILERTIDEIKDYFIEYDKIYRVLNCICEIGLGYLKLGQMSMNLSGGEVKRVKLAKALSYNSKTNNLYILDEPTAGLSEKDIEKLKIIINKLILNGETILIIEHNLEFICSMSDYVIDFGNACGKYAGKIVSFGHTNEVIINKNSSLNDFQDYFN